MAGEIDGQDDVLDTRKVRVRIVHQRVEKFGKVPRFTKGALQIEQPDAKNLLLGTGAAQRFVGRLFIADRDSEPGGEAPQ
jgi:hypothetical protein